MPFGHPHALNSFIPQLGKVGVTTYLTGAEAKAQKNSMACPGYLNNVA